MIIKVAPILSPVYPAIKVNLTRLLIASTVLGLIVIPPLHAQTQRELNKLNSSLKQTEKTLKNNQSKRQQTLEKIEGLEKDIAERSQRYAQTDLKVQDLNIEANAMESDLGALKKQFSSEQDQLSQLIESAYLMGRQNGLKLAFSQQGIQHTARMNHYAHNIAGARQQQINVLDNLQTELQGKSAKLNQQRTQLDNLSTSLKEDQRYLGQLKKNRLAMVKKLDLAIDDGTQEIDQLRQRKARLETLLAKLAKQQKARAKRDAERKKRALAIERQRQKAVKPTNDTPTNVKIRKTVDSRPIISTGTLPMPAKAKIVARFGDKRAKSGLPWSGILMEGQDGTDIRAVNSGEVVYADWLQGYGQMIIIDHGSGIMSLYGHNKSIHKAVGDRVRQSDIIASMGDTAGLAKAALYFEIRKNGVAEDPLKWCRI